MIAFTPNEVPYKTVTKVSSHGVESLSKEIDFDLLWAQLMGEQ